MVFLGRDEIVVQLVARFGQVTSDQVHALVFADLASRTPCYRVLKRLVERRELARIERRIPGGSRGGSGQYVYQLGLHGYHQHKTGRYQPYRSVNYHMLSIVETYIIFFKLHHAERIRLLGYLNEPDCWVSFGRFELKPDLFVELERAGAAGIVRLWLEVDLGSEGQRQIREKLERYWNAYNAADADHWNPWPTVVFVTVDEHRAEELIWLLRQEREEVRKLFRICTQKQLHAAFQLGQVIHSDS